MGAAARTHLGHSLEQRARHALLVRARDLCDEERAGGKHEVGAEDGEDGGGEAEGPVRRVGVDQREEDVGEGGEERADDCVRARVWVSRWVEGWVEGGYVEGGGTHRRCT